jgi:hypothetical protein
MDERLSYAISMVRELGEVPKGFMGVPEFYDRKKWVDQVCQAATERDTLMDKLREFFKTQCPDIGMGDDPLGFVLASHVMINHERQTLAKALEVAVKFITECTGDESFEHMGDCGNAAYDALSEIERIKGEKS